MTSPLYGRTRLARAFSDEVAAGSSKKMRQNQESRVNFRLRKIGICSSSVPAVAMVLALSGCADGRLDGRLDGGYSGEEGRSFSGVHSPAFTSGADWTGSHLSTSKIEYRGGRDPVSGMAYVQEGAPR